MDKINRLDIFREVIQLGSFERGGLLPIEEGAQIGLLCEIDNGVGCCLGYVIQGDCVDVRHSIARLVIAGIQLSIAQA